MPTASLAARGAAVSALVVPQALALLVQGAAPLLLREAPLVLLALHPLEPWSLLVSTRTDVLPFIAVLVTVRVVPCCGGYLVGRWYGQTALDRLSRGRRLGRLARTVQRLSARTRGALLLVYPGATASVLAGVDGLRVRRFLPLMLTGLVLWALVTRLVATAAAGPLSTAAAALDRWAVPAGLLLLSTTVLVHLWRGRTPAQDERAASAGPKSLQARPASRNAGPVDAEGVDREEVVMRAAVVTSFEQPLQVREVPRPDPGPGQLRVRLEASGICHTDIHAARGDWPVKPQPPFIPGHEGVGVIDAVGDGVDPERIGQRVAIPWLGSACGTCEHCISGWETLCESQQNTGYSIDGGYAEYAVATAAYVVPVPDGVSSFDAAPLTCAGVTTYKAVQVSGARSSDLVAVFGIGGLGHLAVQYARIAGAEVVAVDVEDDKLELARELGAAHVVNARDEDPAAAITALGGADVAIALAVSPASMRQAFDSLKRGGRLVLVALPRDNDLPLPIFQTVLKGITVIGSIVGTRRDLAEVFELHANGRTRVVAEGRKLDDINGCFDEVLSGAVPARLVLEL